MKLNNYSLVAAEGQCAEWVVFVMLLEPRSQKSIFKQVPFQKILTQLL